MLSIAVLVTLTPGAPIMTRLSTMIPSSNVPLSHSVSDLIAQHHPHLDVIGNMLPDHLVPFKIAENKYVDSRTNKYVLYPQIGSFEVILNDTLLFSKK